MRPSDADLTSTALETDQQAASQPRYVYATVPDGTPIRVVAWEGPHALIETPGPEGHRRRCRIPTARAKELLRQVRPDRLRDFCHRSLRSERIGNERWRGLMLTRARGSARARASRGSASRRRGSRRGSSASRAGPSGGDPDPDEPEPPSGRPLHDLNHRGGRR
jgi:hypothetical protein